MIGSIEILDKTFKKKRKISMIQFVVYHPNYTKDPKGR